MIVFLSYIDNVHLSAKPNLFAQKGSKYKMESRCFSTIYKPFSIKVNTSLPLVSCSYNSYQAATGLAIGIRNFSTSLNENKLNVSEEFLFWF